MFTYNPIAPLETHKLNGRAVQIVRADLVPNLPLPPYLKTIELLKFVAHLKETVKPKLVGFYGQDVSEWTWALPMICQAEGIRGLIGFAKKKKVPKWVDRLGENVYWLSPNMYQVNYYRMKRYVEAEGGIMLPIGVEHPFVVKTVEDFFKISPLPDSDILIVPTGGGVCLAGIINRVVGAVRPKTIIGVCTRSPKSVHTLLARHCASDELARVQLVSGEEARPMPFPGHSYWEGRAWAWLEKNSAGLKGSLTFINLGNHSVGEEER